MKGHSLPRLFGGTGHCFGHSSAVSQASQVAGGVHRALHRARGPSLARSALHCIALRCTMTMSHRRLGVTAVVRGFRGECDRHKEAFTAEYEGHMRWLEEAVATTKQRVLNLKAGRPIDMSQYDIENRRQSTAHGSCKEQRASAAPRQPVSLHKGDREAEERRGSPSPSSSSKKRQRSVSHASDEAVDQPKSATTAAKEKEIESLRAIVPSKLKVVELKDMLKDFGVKPLRLKADLVEQLETAIGGRIEELSLELQANSECADGRYSVGSIASADSTGSATKYQAETSAEHPSAQGTKPNDADDDMEVEVSVSPSPAEDAHAQSSEVSDVQAAEEEMEVAGDTPTVDAATSDQEEAKRISHGEAYEGSNRDSSSARGGSEGLATPLEVHQVGDGSRTSDPEPPSVSDGDVKPAVGDNEPGMLAEMEVDHDSPDDSEHNGLASSVEIGGRAQESPKASERNEVAAVTPALADISEVESAPQPLYPEKLGNGAAESLVEESVDTAADSLMHHHVSAAPEGELESADTPQSKTPPQVKVGTENIRHVSEPPVPFTVAPTTAAPQGGSLSMSPTIPVPYNHSAKKRTASSAHVMLENLEGSSKKQKVASELREKITSIKMSAKSASRVAQAQYLEATSAVVHPVAESASKSPAASSSHEEGNPLLPPPSQAAATAITFQPRAVPSSEPAQASAPVAIPRPANLVSGLHSLTSLVAPRDESAKSAPRQPTEASILKRAEEARRRAMERAALREQYAAEQLGSPPQSTPLSRSRPDKAQPLTGVSGVSSPTGSSAAEPTPSADVEAEIARKRKALNAQRAVREESKKSRVQLLQEREQAKKRAEFEEKERRREERLEATKRLKAQQDEALRIANEKRHAEAERRRLLIEAKEAEKRAQIIESVEADRVVPDLGATSASSASQDSSTSATAADSKKLDEAQAAGEEGQRRKAIESRRAEEDARKLKQQQYEAEAKQAELARLEAAKEQELARHAEAARLREIEQQKLQAAAAAVPKEEVIVSYEISDKEEEGDDSSDDESRKRARALKPKPDWVKRAELDQALKEQYGPNGRDPDTIFTDVETCDLEEIFAGKDRERYTRRGSSAEWGPDRITQAERIAYKRTVMAQYKRSK
jgi:hypothetical protein